MNESLKAFAGTIASGAIPLLTIDARYEKVREAGIMMNKEVPIAVGIDWHGGRQILAVAMAYGASRAARKDFLVALKRRGLRGVELAWSPRSAK